jgi:hypothetical protein
VGGALYLVALLVLLLIRKRVPAPGTASVLARS